MIEIGLILTLLVAVIIFFTYWIPKKLGFSKIGKYLSIVLLLLIISSITFVIFEDDLFSKSDVRDLLSEQNIQIKDDFEIEENKSMIAPGDYYHTFTLSIAPSDKNRLSDEIKRSPNFNKDKLVETYLYDQSDYHYGPKRIKNYETADHYIRELFEPHGAGYAPTWRKIKLDKRNNQLVFEDKDE